MHEELKHWRRLVEHGPTTADILRRNSKRLVARSTAWFMSYVVGVCFMLEGLRMGLRHR